MKSPLETFLSAHHISYEAFKAFVAGLESNSEVVTPFSGAIYQKARMESDPAFDEKYPLIVVYCGGAADVVAGVKFAQSQRLKVCARAGEFSLSFPFHSFFFSFFFLLVFVFVSFIHFLTFR